MREDADMLTLEDALACIKRHFTESDDLLAHIEMGEEVDQSQAQILETAFQVMQTAWMDKSFVPKYAVQLVRTAIDAIPRLEQCILLYPQREAEISRFIGKVGDWTETGVILPKSMNVFHFFYEESQFCEMLKQH